MSKPKPSKATVIRRVEEIVRLVADGAAWIDVREYVREQEQIPGSAWELATGCNTLSDSQLFRYIARADQVMADSVRASRKKLLRLHRARRLNLYAKAVSQGDIRTALAVLSDEAKLLGLYPPAKMEHTGAKGEAIKITTIEAIKPPEVVPTPDAATVPVVVAAVPQLVEAVKPEEEPPR